MINKFYKTIHNKYSLFFRFLFFLRYLFVIFLTAIILFLLIPNFFNYENRVKIINNLLNQNYNFNITKYENVVFKSFPFPKLEFKNVIINIDTSKLELSVKKLEIYPKLFSIYNYKNFQTNKIILKNSNIILDNSNLKFLIKNIITQKYRIDFKNLNLNITDNGNFLTKVKDIKFSNYGYKKNIIEGKIFDRKFKTKIGEKLNSVHFKLINSGINVDIDLEHQQNDAIKGLLKSKILNSNLKFNFEYDGNVLNIYNSFFRSKNLSLKNRSKIIIEPYLDLNSNFIIEDLDIKVFDKIQIDKLVLLKETLKKINSTNEISFTSKKFSQHFIEKFYLKFSLAYGRLNFSKYFSISENFFQCDGNLNLLDEYPVLIYECSILSENKKKFLKIFNINSKKDDQNFNLITKGKLNILNRKINFKEISIDKNYKASREDLVYFKEVFESILFDGSFIEIFNLRKIKRFILEIL